MNLSLKEFEAEISELRQHLQYIQNISTEIGEKSSLYMYVNSVTKRTFNYKSLIISLYGIVENYSDKFIKAYLENLTAIISEYSNLKEVIKKKNIRNSADLTLKVFDNKYLKYKHLKEVDLIKNLNSCLTDVPNYLLNYDGFTILSGNMKHAKICELFKQIDLDLNQEFRKHTDFNLSNSENQFIKLDELVEMRNEVAHGSVISLMDPSQIVEYVNFIEKYFKSLYKILAIDLEQEKLKYWTKFHCIEIENAKVFSGNIVGFSNLKNIPVTNESLIIIMKSDGSFQSAEILNIKSFDNNDLTLKLKSNTNLTGNRKFFYKIIDSAKN